MIKVNFEPKMDDARIAEILKEIAHDKMGGWMELPRKYDMGELVRIKEAGKKIQDESEYLVCIGIGGSYLGARAVIDALTGSFDNYLPAKKRKNPQLTITRQSN